MLKIRNNTEWK